MDNRQPLHLLSTNAQTCDTMPWSHHVHAHHLTPFSFPTSRTLGRFLYWTIRATSWLDDETIGGYIALK